MINIGLDVPQTPLRILCLGAHSDDIEIGCGGTVVRLLNSRRCHVDWVVFSAKKSRRREALHGARLFLRGAKTKNVVTYSFTDGFFPYEGAKIKRRFESLKRTVTPSLIFTHYREDLHQDHRLINELTWNTFRNHLILEYEIPKYDGGLGSPNLFVELKDSVRRLKLDHLRTAFASQRTKHWFSEDVFSGMLRLRGVEAAAASGFAEAFYSRKLCL
jgi:LmbE family N-acetylglucosaminyl deacetylase